MRWLAAMGVVLLGALAWSAEIESRALTTYLPQDLLETVVRKEGWTEVVLKPYGGVRKGDRARIWAGGVVDYNNGTAPGEHVAAPQGLDAGKLPVGVEPDRFSLSPDLKHAFAVLFKSEDGVAHPCHATGKPLEIPLTREGARLWVGYNDLRGRHGDNHLGRGRRHELDPLWVRVEIIRIVVD